MRNLATIQTISKLEDIEGKDRIKLASFTNTGWKVIVDFSFKVGDEVIYCESDTLLPADNPNFEFLRKRCFLPKYNAYRITCMKMAGVMSEGIVFPKSILSDPSKFKDGDDVTEEIKAVKYDPELELENAGASVQKKKSWLATQLLRIPFIKKLAYPEVLKGSWPSFFPGKTDETRVQSIPYVIDTFKGKEVYITEKMDGTSSSFGLVKCGFLRKKLVVCSRNQWYKNRVNNYYWNVAIKYELKDVLSWWKEATGDDIVIQGEICGPGIQGNKYNFTELKLFIFNIYSVKEKTYYSLNQMREFVSRSRIFEIVPVVEEGKFTYSSIEELVALSRGNSVKNPSALREGIVIRPVEPGNPDKGMKNMMSFKVINPDFKLKWEK